MATLKNNSKKSSVSLGLGVFIILSVVIGFIVIGYFEVKQNNSDRAIMDSPEIVIINELSDSQTIDARKEQARLKFNSIEKSYYEQGNTPIEISLLSGVEKELYNSEFGDKLNNVYFRTTKLSTIKKYRGKYRFATNPQLASYMYHFLNEYTYYDYPEDEFKRRKIKREQKRLLQTKDRDNELNDSYYALISRLDSKGYEDPLEYALRDYDFRQNRFPIFRMVTRSASTDGKNLILVNKEYEDRIYTNSKNIHVAFKNRPSKLYIKMKNETQAEKFKNSRYSFRINFHMTKAYKSLADDPDYKVYEREGILVILHTFKVSGSILSIELHSDVLGTLVWIPDDALKGLD